MKKISLKSLLPHLAAVVIFVIVALIYCKPALDGKVLQQNDVTQWKAMSHDAYKYKETHGHMPLWTNGMFSGMPTYLIATWNNNVVPDYFTKILSLGLPKPFNFFVLACICFYILTQVLRVNPWVGIVGALTYAYATYNPVIVVAGHDTKMLSIGILPAFIGAVILIYERRYWLGAALTAAFTAALVVHQHYQITYYALLIILAMTIAYAIRWIRQGEWKHLIIAGCITAGAGLVGVLCNAVVLFTNYEYTQATIRGGSGLSDEAGGKSAGKEATGGLKADYAMQYSLKLAEPLVMFIPHIYGGANMVQALEVPEDKSKAVEALQAMPPQLAQQLQQEGFLSFYWGGLIETGLGTSGPPYAGAIVVFLAIIGFVILDGKHKWWILAMITLSILMSWGSYFEGFNAFLLKHAPMFNKFRAPSMVLVIPTVLLNFMAVMTLQELLFGGYSMQVLWEKYRRALYITAGLFVLCILCYLSFDYYQQHDHEILQRLAGAPEQVSSQVKTFINGLTEDRKGLFLGDIFRSLGFVLVAAVVVLLFIKNRIKPMVALAVIGAFAFIDLIAVDSKYLGSEQYQEEIESATDFQPTPIDKAILQDTSWYRVLDLRDGINGAFNKATSAYFHHSIGGYHPAKLSLYQDLIEKQLLKFPDCLGVLNMLNTKYIIDPRQPAPIPNPDALGAAWFVKTLRLVDGPNQEMNALTGFHPKDTAVAQKALASALASPFTYDSSATIRLVKNDNDVVTYMTSAVTPQLAVFSEVYYEKGWKAFVDGVQKPYSKVDYVLRGMIVPAGKHTVEFRFEPSSWKTGWTLTTICSILTVLLLLAGLFMHFRKSAPPAA